MVFGGFGTAVVVGPPVAKVLFGTALVYAAVQLYGAYRRA